MSGVIAAPHSKRAMIAHTKDVQNDSLDMWECIERGEANQQRSRVEKGKTYTYARG